MSILKQLGHRIRVFFSVLVSTANLLAILVTLLAFLGLGSAVFGYSNGLLPLLIVGIVVVILSVLLLIFIYTFALELKRAISSVNIAAGVVPTYPDPQSEQEVELLLKEIVYQYFPDRQHLRQRKRFRVRALRDGVDSFTDRYKWTGSGQCDVKSLTSGFTVTNRRTEEFWDYFDVGFPHAIRKDEEVDFTIEWELFDAAQAAVPFLSTMIDYDTKHLTMNVILPPELAPKGAYCYEFYNYIDRLPMSTQATQWDAARQSISYDVPHPKKYRKYMIRLYS